MCNFSRKIRRKMKTSFRDKYIEICENTLQSPGGGGYTVKGTLLSHLKLNVCPVVECGKTEPERESTKKKPLEKQRSSLQRKQCLRRNTDHRSRAEKARSIAVYERKIGNTSDTDLSKTQLATDDGYLIPQEIQEQILKARQASRNRVEQPRESFVDDNNNTLGTFINVSYRDSKRGIKVDSKGPVHPYVQVKHRTIHRMSSDGRDVVDSQDDFSEDEENPYSTARELDEELRTLPRYYIIDDEQCSGLCIHDIMIEDCTECESEPVYSEPSSCTGDEEDTYRELCFDTDKLPEEYLTRTTVLKTNSNESSSTSLDEVDGITASIEPFYYVLEEQMKDELLKRRNSSSAKKALPDIVEDNESEEIFV